MKNGKLITLIIACIIFIGGLATGNILNYHNEKKSSSSSSVESSIKSTVESTKSHKKNRTTSIDKNSTIKLLNTMRNTDYDTVKVNDKVYNIIGYIKANENNNNIIHNGINIDERSIDCAIDNIKALVLLDTPVIYIDENNQSHTLESYRWLAYITDNYNSANLVTYAAVGEDGTVIYDIYYDYEYNYDNNSMTSNIYTTSIKVYKVSYESLIEQGIIEGNTHWSVE